MLIRQKRRGNNKRNAVIAQLVEHFLGKEEVTSSNLVNSSKNLHAVCRDCVLFWLYRKIASTQWDSEFLCDLSKKLTIHLMYKLYAVLPLFSPENCRKSIAFLKKMCYNRSYTAERLGAILYFILIVPRGNRPCKKGVRTSCRKKCSLPVPLFVHWQPLW